MDFQAFRYGPFAGGGVAEFFAAHGVDLHDVPLEQRKSLLHALEAQLRNQAEDDFVVTISGTQFVFEGPDEMGNLHFHLNGTL